MHRPVRVTTLSRAQIATVRAAYLGVCREYVRKRPNDRYTRYVQTAIENPAAIDRRIRAFQLYSPYIEPGMRVLDWGCRHAPDACMLKTLYHDIEVYGCDFGSEDFGPFYDYANLLFTPLTHSYELPYEAGQFDAVISSGVLEHVALESESLKEIWRVLRNSGVFVVTFLPNRSSLAENIGRLLKAYSGHNRLYARRETLRLFCRSGFVIEQSGFHQIIPRSLAPRKNLTETKFGLSDCIGAGLNAANSVLEHVFPVNRLASNLYFILRRVDRM